MVSPENTNWLMEYGLIDDIPVPDANFSVPVTGFSWPVQNTNGPSNVGLVKISVHLSVRFLLTSFNLSFSLF